MGRYFRVRLVNDDAAQTYLRLFTYFGESFIPSNHPYNQSISLDTDAITTRPSNFQDEVRIGRRTGVTGWTKFAYNDDVDSSTGEETVWASTATFTPMSSSSTFRIEYDNTRDGSTSNGATVLAIYYVDGDGNPQVGTHVLGSSGVDTTSFGGFGINRVAVASSGYWDTNVGLIRIKETAGMTEQAIVPSSGSVTQTSIFVNGANHDAVAKFLTFNVNKLSGSSPKVTVKGYIYNRSVDTKYEIYRHTIDSSAENTVTLNEPIGFNMSPTDVLWFVADSDQNNTAITLRFSLNQYQRD